MELTLGDEEAASGFRVVWRPDDGGVRQQGYAGALRDQERYGGIPGIEGLRRVVGREDGEDV